MENEAREVEEPELEAGSWALADLRSGELLVREDAKARLPMASTTKIMAAAFATPAYSTVGLVAGETLSVRELLMATMISSGDDAAYTLAEHLGGEAGVEDFVGEMNREAERLGLADTRFENPVGLDAYGHHTSARPGADDAPRDAIPGVP